MTLPTSKGQAIYSSKMYHSLDYFVHLHLNGAASRESDRLHDGQGVLTQHASLTMKFELALQSGAVIPSNPLLCDHENNTNRSIAGTNSPSLFPFIIITSQPSRDRSILGLYDRRERNGCRYIHSTL